MSFFDPQRLYSHHQNYSHKGQINRKKPVKRHYALNTADLKNAIDACHAYGYYVSSSPPVDLTLRSIFNTYYVSLTPQTQSYSFGWNELYSSINNTYILQNAPEGSQFTLTIYLMSISCKIQKGSAANTMQITSDNINLSRSISYSTFAEITPYNSVNYQLVYGDQNQTFNYNTNVTQSNYSPNTGYISKYETNDIDSFRENHLPSSPAFAISNTSSSSYVMYVTASFAISINAAY